MASFLDLALPGALGAFLRLLLVLGNTTMFLVSITSPNPTPSKADRQTVSGLETVSIILFQPITRYFALAPGIADFIVTFARLVGPSYVSGTCAERITLNVPIVVAFLMSLCGMGIRLWCYRALGRLFTFELALLPDHQLVVTGPYAFVRHPSYTGALLALGGMTLANMSRGSWAYECGIASSWWGAGWGTMFGIGAMVIISRCAREDRLLRARFKEEWDRWSGKVRWRVVPWVY